jgi:hypothetical protein
VNDEERGAQQDQAGHQALARVPEGGERGHQEGDRAEGKGGRHQGRTPQRFPPSVEPAPHDERLHHQGIVGVRPGDQAREGYMPSFAAAEDHAGAEVPVHPRVPLAMRLLSQHAQEGRARRSQRQSGRNGEQSGRRHGVITPLRGRGELRLPSNAHQRDRGHESEQATLDEEEAARRAEREHPEVEQDGGQPEPEGRTERHAQRPPPRGRGAGPDPSDQQDSCGQRDEKREPEPRRHGDRRNSTRPLPKSRSMRNPAGVEAGLAGSKLPMT